MVLVAGSIEVRYSDSGAVGAGWRHAESWVASQRLGLTTDRMLAPPTLTRYRELSCGISTKKLGNGLYSGPWLGAACWAGASLGQPEVMPPRQVWVLIADSVSSFWFIANTVCTAGCVLHRSAPKRVSSSGLRLNAPGVPPRGATVGFPLVDSGFTTSQKAHIALAVLHYQGGEA